MTDIRTVKEVHIGSYRITVAEDGDEYQAAVTGSYIGSNPIRDAMSQISSGEPADEWVTVDDAPRVIRDGKYTAAGAAAEAYLDAGEESDD